MFVKDAMTPELIGVAESSSLLDALKLMVSRQISALVVFDAIGAPVGVLSEGDLMRRFEFGDEKQRPRWLEFLIGGGRSAREYSKSRGRRVHEVMTAGVLHIDANADIGDAVDLMQEKRVRRLMVVDGADPVGILSRSDLVRALIRALPADLRSQSDDDIQAAIEAELENQAWAPVASVRVAVYGGAVTLNGSIPDEALREALKVLAENVPGVKTVRDRLAWIEPNSGVYMNAPGES